MTKKEVNKKEDIRLVRFKAHTQMNDLTGYVTEIDGKVNIRYPLVTILDNIFEEGRQALMMYEFLPQALISIKEFTFDKSEILFIEPVKAGFMKQYIVGSKFFYEADEHTLTKKPTKSEQSHKQEYDADDLGEEGEFVIAGEGDTNVIDIIEALKERGNKPKH